MQTLDVVNAMLGTLGEAPLNSLADPHAFRYAAISSLDAENEFVQSSGHWFNRETVTIQKNVGDGKFYVANDIIDVSVPNYPQYVQRDRVLYDVAKGSPFLDETEITAKVIRLLAFDTLPSIARTYIGNKAIARFQVAYDGDPVRTQQINQLVQAARVDFNATATRQAALNLADNDATIQKLRRNHAARYYIPR